MNRIKIFALVFVALFILVGADGSSCVGITPDPGTGTGGGVGSGADDFTGVDPQALNNESLRAAGLASYLMGNIGSSPGVDENTDEATLEGLAAQDAPMASMAVNDWLAMLDPMAIPAASYIPKEECAFDPYFCPLSPKCFNSGSWSSTSHRCRPVDCGLSKCTPCPDSWPDFLKSIAVKSWCAYVCVQTGVSPPPIVAVGAVGITRFGPFPSAGAWCFEP